VHGLAGEDGVDARIGQRDLFRAAGQGTYRAKRAPQLGEHGRVGLHGRDLSAETHQGFGQFAGSRA